MPEIRIERSGGYVRRPCFVCGGETDKSDVFATCEVGVVCEECLEAGSEAVAARLTHRAEHLEEAASELRRLALEDWTMPTLAALREVSAFEDALDYGFDAESGDAGFVNPWLCSVSGCNYYREPVSPYCRHHVDGHAEA